MQGIVVLIRVKGYLQTHTVPAFGSLCTVPTVCDGRTMAQLFIGRKLLGSNAYGVMTTAMQGSSTPLKTISL